MRFNRNKCRVLHLRRYNCMHQYRLRNDLLEIICEQKNLDVLVGNRLSMSRQCAFAPKKVYCTLGCT